MLRITTESGANYLYDVEKERVMRKTGPFSRGINYDLVPDAEWQFLVDSSELRIGECWNMVFDNDPWRRTTPIVDVKPIPDEEDEGEDG